MLISMTRRDLLTRLLQAAVFAPMGVTASGTSRAYAPISASQTILPSTRLNVVFITVDDLRPELGCYGHPVVQSPNIDRLAADGMMFTRTYCQQAACAPSRSSVLSGARPDTTGIYDILTPLRDVMPDVLTLPQHFKNNGYRTMSMGKVYHHHGDDRSSWNTQDSSPVKSNWAFQENVGNATEMEEVADTVYHDGVLADNALEALRTYGGNPFFLALGFRKPHLPFTAPKHYWDLYDQESLNIPSTLRPNNAPAMAFSGNYAELRSYTDIPDSGNLEEEKAKELIHAYYACVSFVDAQIGRVLDELDRLDCNGCSLRDNTIVILWGDHGWKLGEYGDWAKRTNFEFDTHVPMIIRLPGVLPNQQCHALTEAVDIYPTLAELCGLYVPAHCEGISMAPLLVDPEKDWKTAAFSQYPREDGTIMGHSLRTDRWRYNEWIELSTEHIVARELYDHALSPLAAANLADEPEHVELVKQLSTMMLAGWRGAWPYEWPKEYRSYLPIVGT